MEGKPCKKLEEKKKSLTIDELKETKVYKCY